MTRINACFKCIILIEIGSYDWIKLSLAFIGGRRWSSVVIAVDDLAFYCHTIEPYVRTTNASVY